MSVQRALLDTSVFIAAESGRPLRADALPEEAAISFVTKAELRVGVLAAADIETRDRRLKTFGLSSRMPALPVDEAVADCWAQMRAYLAASGRRVNVNDAWIAATAAAHRLPLVAQDADFEPLIGVAGLTVVPV